MAPLTPHWARPSHPEVQEVIINEREFTSKSLSTVNLPPFGLLAKMEFPPCTLVEEPSYATVQCGRDQHLLLNSDLMYINHSCEPTLIFDTGNSNIIAGPNGIKEGEELTFFYPSTEWDMAQPFDCLCGKQTCRGKISGAKDMTKAQLDGLWLNRHIRQLLEEQQLLPNTEASRNDHSEGQQPEDVTARALKDALEHAEKVVEAARVALQSYAQSPSRATAGLARRGLTSRELSGEMGGDTSVA